MVDFFLHPENVFFVIALGLMVAIGLLEFATTILGFGLSGLIDSAIPDLEIDVDMDVDLDVDADMDIGPNIDADAGPGGTVPSGLDLGKAGYRGGRTRFLLGLGIGRVPILILLIIFLLSFGLSGLFFQLVIEKISGYLLNRWIVLVPALAAAVFFLRIIGAALARLIPKAGGQATSEKTFIGRVAQITLGTARFGHPAQAKLRDGYGQTHYVMVQPEREGIVFNTGQSVLLVDRQGAVFIAYESPIEARDDAPPKPLEEPDEDG